jgi:hypothetical protein
MFNATGTKKNTFIFLKKTDIPLGISGNKKIANTRITNGNDIIHPRITAKSNILPSDKYPPQTKKHKAISDVLTTAISVV